MARYESEHTKFMRQWLVANPVELKEKEQGRALWWDKPPRNLEAQKSDILATVPPKAYYYDAN